MKYFNFIFVCLVLLSTISFALYSCTKKDNVDDTVKHLEVRTLTNLLVKAGTEFSLFYNIDENEFYKIQYTSTPTIPQTSTFVGRTSNSLSIKEGTTNIIYTYTVGDNVLGVGHLKGEGYNQLFLDSTLTDFVIDIDTGEEMCCKCRVDGSKDKDCEQGGVGSSSCEVTDGGGVGTVNWTNHCQVSCKEGYFACCKELPPPPIGGGE